MCFKKQVDKWTKFIPTAAYLPIVKLITSVIKLVKFLEKFQYTGEVGDVWQTPEEFLKNLHLDCDDFMRFNVDVLNRIMGIEAQGLIHSGYNKARWGKELHHHAVAIFPYKGKLAIFNNKELVTGFDSYEDAGHHYFPDGLTYQEVRDWQGKVLSKKRKWIGVF